MKKCKSSDNVQSAVKFTSTTTSPIEIGANFLATQYIVLYRNGFVFISLHDNRSFSIPSW